MRSDAASKKRVFVTFAVLAVAWIVLDQATKAAFSSFLQGSGAVAIIPGVLDAELVHNIGAAWGIFGGASAALAILSIAVCAFIIFYLVKMRERSSMVSVVGLSLVFAGGIGNMIDRLAFGHVIDFISLTFIDFPVFNVADIGVTCGLVLFLIGIVVRERKA